MSLRRLFLPLFCCTVWLVATRAADADILAEELFAHPGGNLVGQTPIPGPGSAWVAHDDVGRSPVQVNNGKVILIQAFGSGGREDVSLPFAVQATGALLFARFDFMLPSSTNLTGDPPGLNRGSIPPTPLDDEGLYFAHFKSDEATTQFRARTGVVQPTSGGDFGLAINANGQNLGGGTTWATDLSFDTIYRVVISWDGTTGVSKLWLDPTDESSANISHTVTPTDQQMEAFALRQSNDYDGQQIIDNLVVATTFSEALAGSGIGDLPGDYNGDGTVNAADYTIWRDTLGSTTDLRANGDNTGGSANLIDTADYDFWKSNFNSPLGAGGGSLSRSVVPEPATILLFASGLAILATRRRRTRE